MNYAKGVFAACLAVLLGSCTPGAPAPPSGAAAKAGAVVIEVSLLKYAPQPSQNGIVAGYNNDALTVPVGSTIQFHNQDNFTHTASFLGTNGFPNGDPLTDKARQQSGSDLSTPGWSTGDLQANAYSQPLTASKPGTYYYGCFFHLLTPMRGWITVK